MLILVPLIHAVGASHVLVLCEVLGLVLAFGIILAYLGRNILL